MLGADAKARESQDTGPRSEGSAASEPPLRVPAHVVVRGLVVAPALCLEAGIAVAVAVPGGVPQSVACDRNGGFVFGAMPRDKELRLAVRGAAIEDLQAVVGESVEQERDGEWILQPIVATSVARIGLTANVPTDVWDVLHEYGVLGELTVTARLQPPRRSANLAATELELRPGDAPCAGELVLSTVDPVLVSWSLRFRLLNWPVLVHTSSCAFDPKAGQYEPSVFDLGFQRLLFGKVVDADGRQLPRSDVLVHADSWSRDARTDASGRFVIVAPDAVAVARLSARYGTQFKSAPIEPTPGEPSILRVDTSGAVRLRVRGPDGTFPQWCGVATSSHRRLPRAPLDGLFSTTDGIVVLKRPFLDAGTLLYVYGTDFEGSVRITSRVAGGDAPLEVKVENELLHRLTLRLRGGPTAPMFVSLSELDHGQLNGRSGRGYSMVGAEGQREWTLAPIAAGTYVVVFRLVGAGSVCGRALVDIVDSSRIVDVVCEEPRPGTSWR